jgi:hypothetical protein
MPNGNGRRWLKLGSMCKQYKTKFSLFILTTSLHVVRSQKSDKLEVKKTLAVQWVEHNMAQASPKTADKQTAAAAVQPLIAVAPGVNPHQPRTAAQVLTRFYGRWDVR